MQKLAEICIRRPVFAAMLILSLVVVGAAGYFRLGVDRFPAVDLPTVRVSTSLPGAAPEEVESLISQPLEEALNTIEGIKELRSINRQGVSMIIVTFELTRPIDVAAQDVRDRVFATIGELPREADPPVIVKADNDLSPVLTIALTGNRPRRELTEMADKIVKVQLERSLGVGEVEIVGGLERAINVWVDPDRLAAYQVPITAVRDALVRQNADVPGGNVTSPVREHVLRTMGRIVDPRQFNDLVVATRNGSPIRVRDLGWSEDGTKEPRSVALLNGEPTVTLEIRRQSGANTVAVIEALKAKIPPIVAQLPADVNLVVIRDQSRYIYEALHEIKRHLILGSLLACLVVVAFMRNWRAMVIAGVAIPTSVIATFGMMKLMGFTLNSVTMLALVLMVGIVIDDAIVVLENIFRFVEEKRMRALRGGQGGHGRDRAGGHGHHLQPGGHLRAGLLHVQHLGPLSFPVRHHGGGGGDGELAGVVHPDADDERAAVTRGMAALGSQPRPNPAAVSTGTSTGPTVGSSAGRLRHRAAVAVLAVLAIASSVPLYRQVRQEYIPSNVDEGEFDVNVTAPEGASITAMTGVALQIEKELRSLKGVRLVLASIGGGSALGSVNAARYYVRLVPHEERTFSLRRLLQLQPWKAFAGNFTQRDVIQEVRRRMKQFPDVRASIRNPQTITLGGPNSDIDFAMLGPDLQRLAEYADTLRRRAPELGLLDADITLRLDKPELQVDIDRDRAAQLGVDSSDIATALRLMVGGEQKVSRYRDPSMNEDYYVQLRLSEGRRNDAEAITGLYVPRQNGGLVRLDNLVRLRPAEAASRIDRLDRQRAVNLRAAIAPGYALADRLVVLRAAAADLNMPPAYSTRVSGRAREMESTFREFLWAFLLSVVLMYIILASQFESIVHPFTILLSLPLSIPFALLTLWLTDNTINLYSALGILVLFGVVKKNAILQIDHSNKLREAGLEQLPAILQANRDRLRPILMTTLTLVAGMLPMALGTGPGAEERHATAVVVIGGQSLCLLLTLIVTPVAYSLLDDLGARLRISSSKSVAPAPAVAPS